MMMRVFTLFDKKAEVYTTPFMSRTNGTAYREISSSLKGAQPGDIMATNPGDFELCAIGDFDEQTGELVPCRPQVLGSLADITAE